MQLWPGQFVNVRLLLETLEQVVVVPTSAVQRGPDGTFVYVVGDENKVGMRPVTLAQQDDANAVVSQGLTAADLVVTAGFARLKDGAEVKVAPPGPAPGAAATPGEPQADASGLTPASDTASIVPATVPPPAADGQGRHKRGDGTHRGQRKARALLPAARPEPRPAPRHAHPMSVSSPFIDRPIATSLLGLATVLGGALGYFACRCRRCRRSISRPSR